MDSLITAAGRALAMGDPLGALNRVALREDAPALALRGIAMAQLGDLARAKALLARAARAFGPRQAVERARCMVAEAEIALVSRDLGWPPKTLEAARALLEGRGDRLNGAHARRLEAQRLLLTGRLDEAERALAQVDPAPLPPALRAAHELVVAGVAIRRVRAGAARAALERADAAAQASGVAGLAAEVAAAQAALEAPAGRLIARGSERALTLDAVEVLNGSDALIIDACRNLARRGVRTVSLSTRPVLFALARTLGEAWPQDASREALLKTAFGARDADESHRARLRVEIGRLRAELAPLAEVSASAGGFVLAPREPGEVVVLAPPQDSAHGEVLALLADGEAWSSSALALALGTSQRSVQRALEALAGEGRAEPVGEGRSRRWMTPLAAGFPTSLLLPAPSPGS
jgi:hypothetical protein